VTTAMFSERYIIKYILYLYHQYTTYEKPDVLLQLGYIFRPTYNNIIKVQSNGHLTAETCRQV